MRRLTNEVVCAWDLESQAHSFARNAEAALFHLRLFRAAVDQQRVCVLHMGEDHPGFLFDLEFAH